MVSRSGNEQFDSFEKALASYGQKYATRADKDNYLIIPSAEKTGQWMIAHKSDLQADVQQRSLKAHKKNLSNLNREIEFLSIEIETCEIVLARNEKELADFLETPAGRAANEAYQKGLEPAFEVPDFEEEPKEKALDSEKSQIFSRDNKEDFTIQDSPRERINKVEEYRKTIDEYKIKKKDLTQTHGQLLNQKKALDQTIEKFEQILNLKSEELSPSREQKFSSLVQTPQTQGKKKDIRPTKTYLDTLNEYLAFKSDKYDQIDIDKLTEKFVNELEKNEFRDWYRSLLPGERKIFKSSSINEQLKMIEKGINHKPIFLDKFVGPSFPAKNLVMAGFNCLFDYLETGEIPKELLDHEFDFSDPNVVPSSLSKCKNLGDFLKKIGEKQTLNDEDFRMLFLIPYAFISQANMKTSDLKLQWTSEEELRKAEIEEIENNYRQGKEKLDALKLDPNDDLYKEQLYLLDQNREKAIAIVNRPPNKEYDDSQIDYIGQKLQELFANPDFKRVFKNWNNFTKMQLLRESKEKEIITKEVKADDAITFEGNRLSEKSRGLLIQKSLSTPDQEINFEQAKQIFIYFAKSSGLPPEKIGLIYFSPSRNNYALMTNSGTKSLDELSEDQIQFLRNNPHIITADEYSIFYPINNRETGIATRPLVLENKELANKLFRTTGALPGKCGILYYDALGKLNVIINVMNQDKTEYASIQVNSLQEIKEAHVDSLFFVGIDEPKRRFLVKTANLLR